VGEPQILTTNEAADLLRVSRQSLAKWRVSGDGPPYLKLGRRVLYRSDDLESWLGARRRRSTSSISRSVEALTEARHARPSLLGRDE
jgi:excisionase family DNA binding protein